MLGHTDGEESAASSTKRLHDNRAGGASGTRCKKVRAIYIYIYIYIYMCGGWRARRALRLSVYRARMLFVYFYIYVLCLYVFLVRSSLVLRGPLSPFVLICPSVYYQ